MGFFDDLEKSRMPQYVLSYYNRIEDIVSPYKSCDFATKILFDAKKYLKEIYSEYQYDFSEKSLGKQCYEYYKAMFDIHRKNNESHIKYGFANIWAILYVRYILIDGVRTSYLYSETESRGKADLRRYLDEKFVIFAKYENTPKIFLEVFETRFDNELLNPKPSYEEKQTELKNILRGVLIALYQGDKEINGVAIEQLAEDIVSNSDEFNISSIDDILSNINEFDDIIDKLIDLKYSDINYDLPWEEFISQFTD